MKGPEDRHVYSGKSLLGTHCVHNAIQQTKPNSAANSSTPSSNTSAGTWDIDNTAGYAEPYKDVIHEDQIRLAGAAKAPDYSFRIGGARKFFLEAKKPSIYIKGDPSPAIQLRRVP